MKFLKEVWLFLSVIPKGVYILLVGLALCSFAFCQEGCRSEKKDDSTIAEEVRKNAASNNPKTAQIK